MAWQHSREAIAIEVRNCIAELYKEVAPVPAPAVAPGKEDDTEDLPF